MDTRVFVGRSGVGIDAAVRTLVRPLFAAVTGLVLLTDCGLIEIRNGVGTSATCTCGGVMCAADVGAAAIGCCPVVALLLTDIRGRMLCRGVGGVLGCVDVGRGGVRKDGGMRCCDKGCGCFEAVGVGCGLTAASVPASVSALAWTT